MMNSNDQDPEWDKTRSLLREHLQSPPLPHPDFVNSQVMQAIERLEKTPQPAASSLLRRLIWAGSGALAAALVLTLVVLPRQLESVRRHSYISQVIEARTTSPDMSVSSFQAPGDRATVLWIDGANYIPADEAVR